MKLFKKLFTREVDRQVDAIFHDEVHPQLKSADASASSLNRLLKKNGVTLQIYVATGGDKRGH